MKHIQPIILQLIIYVLLIMFSTTVFSATPLNCVTGNGKNNVTSICTDGVDLTYKYTNGQEQSVPVNGCVIQNGTMTCKANWGNPVDRSTANTASADKPSTGLGFDNVVNSVSSVVSTIGDTFESLYGLISYAIGFVGGLTQMTMQLIPNFIKTACIDFWDYLSTLFSKTVTSLFEYLGLEEFFTSLSTLVNSPIGYFLDLLGFNEYVVATITALYTRFIIRRLPVVG